MVIHKLPHGNIKFGFELSLPESEVQCNAIAIKNIHDYIICHMYLYAASF